MTGYLSAVNVSDGARRQLLMEWVRQLRAKYGTDTAIAARSGLDKSRISRWSRGDVRGGITLTNLVRLAEVSDMTLGDMLMAMYGVEAEQLAPTGAATGITIGTMMALPDGGERFVKMRGDYRLLLLMPEDAVQHDEV